MMMEILLMLIGLVVLAIFAGIAVCWIMVIVTAFKKEESPLMGILCLVLCPLGSLVIGWIKHAEWDIKQLMIIFSCLFAGVIVLQIISTGLAVALGAAAQ